LLALLPVQLRPLVLQVVLLQLVEVQSFLPSRRQLVVLLLLVVVVVGGGGGVEQLLMVVQLLVPLLPLVLWVLRLVVVLEAMPLQPVSFKHKNKNKGRRMGELIIEDFP